MLRGETGSAEPSAGFAPGDGVEVVGRDGGPATFANVVTVDPDGVVVELAGTRLAGLPPSGVLRLRVDDNQRTIRLRAIERVVRERHTLRWVGPVLDRRAARASDGRAAVGTRRNITPHRRAGSRDRRRDGLRRCVSNPGSAWHG